MIRSAFIPFVGIALAAGVLAPLAAPAQNVPSYARPNNEQTIRGRIVSINGTFNITIRDDNGYLDNVELHQGTIINPTGLTLEPGMSVTILGYNAGSAFAANEIDTPYHYAGPRPVPVYLGPGWWYPGYAYGYGPSFSLAIGIGGPGLVRRPFVGHRWAGPRPIAHPFVGHDYAGRHEDFHGRGHDDGGHHDHH
jgi:hypothetical protein